VKHNLPSESTRMTPPYLPTPETSVGHERLIDRRHVIHRTTFNVLAIDIGGTNVKLLATGADERRKFASGPALTPDQMVRSVKELAAGWEYDVVSMGYPGRVVRGTILTEPRNLGPGWVGFDFEAAFGCPVKMMNDAAMQALGSYEGGLMLFLGLGTGVGSAIIADGVVVATELGHLPYKKKTYEDYLGARGLRRLGKKKWRKTLEFGVSRLISAIHPDDVVLGGGNVRKLKEMPAGCRAGGNAFAFVGGFRMWEDEQDFGSPAAAQQQLPLRTQ
jgi:polyphosphate glucokinase